METTTSRYKWLNTVALLLVLPTAYFIIISILKYSLGIDGPFDAIAPWLERMGIKETLGWNINLLILLGPVTALLITIIQVINIQGQFTKDLIQIRLTIRKKWFPVAIAIFSGLLLATLFIYLLGENCNC